MANWKIQDIAPPRRPKQRVEELSVKEEPQKRSIKRSRRLPGWMVKGLLPLFVLVVFLVGVVHIFFAKADVTLWPETRQIKLLEPIAAEVGRAQLDKEERIIPARTLTQEEKVTRLFPASSNTIKVNRASGTIRVFNAYTTTPQTLIVQTRFVSEEGKLFRTPVRITIPGATNEGGKRTPGFLDIEIVAAEPGEDYNIGPSNFSLPGLSGSALFTAIYAESTEPMIGGSERVVSVVSDDDIEKAKESLIEELTEKATEELLSRVPEHMIATKDSIVVKVGEADSLVQAGAEIDQFNVSVSLVATAFLFSKADVDALVDDFLFQELQEGERIAQEKTQVNFQRIAVDKTKNIASLELSIETIAYEHVDPTELKIKLRGKSKEEAESILASFGAFRETSIFLWPFWISSLPGNVDKLRIQVVID